MHMAQCWETGEHNGVPSFGSMFSPLCTFPSSNKIASAQAKLAPFFRFFGHLGPECTRVQKLTLIGRVQNFQRSSHLRDRLCFALDCLGLERFFFILYLACNLGIFFSSFHLPPTAIAEKNNNTANATTSSQSFLSTTKRHAQSTRPSRAPIPPRRLSHPRDKNPRRLRPS